RAGAHRCRRETGRGDAAGTRADHQRGHDVARDRTPAFGPRVVTTAARSAPGRLRGTRLRGDRLDRTSGVRGRPVENSGPVGPRTGATDAHGSGPGRVVAD